MAPWSYCIISMALGTGDYLFDGYKYLADHYDFKKELRFPFGNNYGWGYKYSHKSSHLCYTFFESGAFTVTLQLGDSCVPAVERMLPVLSEKAKEIWKNRYSCGKQGGWIHYRVIHDNDLDDILKLILAKKKIAKL